MRHLPLATVMFGLLIAAGPAATQETPVLSDDVERFCTNIADAARDQRYALQAEELRKLQAEIDARIEALEEKRAEYEEWLRRRETFLARAQDNVVDIYGRMRPDAAAERLTELGPEMAAGILMKLDARRAGIIMNEMETKAAAGVTSVMASAARPKDPS
ncbi:MotE family protein [Aliihoeflea sp. PC F10.4]